MDAALGWIGEFVRWLVAWLPHVGICRATHGGVKFVRGKNVREIKPGLYVWWPITTEIETIPTARQTIDLSAQRLITKDGKVVLIDLVIVYVVEDVVKALVDTADVDDTAADVAREAATQIVTENEYERLRRLIAAEVSTELTRKCRTALKPFGLYVEKVRAGDFAPTRVFSIDGVEFNLGEEEE